MDVSRLEVTSPTGETTIHDLESSVFTVGRRAPTTAPDVALDDQNGVVSRIHCLLEFKVGHWWLTDNQSRNGTFLLRGGERTRLNEPARLQHGDVIHLLAESAANTPSLFWELRIEDPHSTVGVTAELREKLDTHSSSWVEWRPDEVRVIRHNAGAKKNIELRKQGYMLIGYLADRNQAAGGTSVVCPPDELIEAIWGPPDSWDRFRPPTVENLRDVIAAVRKAIEVDTSNPTLLENVRGLGYRLRTT